jgi:hypothetical protein
MLRVGRSGNRIPQTARFPASVQTGPRASGPPTLLYNGHRVSSPRVKRPQPDVDDLPESGAEVKERIRDVPHLLLWALMAYCGVNFTFNFSHTKPLLSKRMLFFCQCHHTSLMDIVVSPPGCGRSVTDF